MNKKNLIVLILTGLLLATLVFWIKNQKKEETPKTEPVFSVIETRKNDYGFKFKLNECLLKDEKEYMVVDIDDSNTYVLASAAQFFKGPHPLTDKDLLKVAVKEVDESSATPLSCGDLKLKYDP